MNLLSDDFIYGKKFYNNYLANDSDILILDLGSQYIKAGYSKYNQPSYIGHNICTYSIDDGKYRYMDDAIKYIDNNRYTSPGHYDISFPLKCGEVERTKSLIDNAYMSYDTSDLFKSSIQHLIYRQLHSKADSLFLVEKYNTSKDHKMLMAEVAFEELDFSKLYSLESPSLSLISAGMTSGLIYESGADLTTMGSVLDCKIDRQRTKTLEFGGISLLNTLIQYINKLYRYDYSNYYTILEDYKKNYFKLETQTKPSNYQVFNETYNSYALDRLRHDSFILPDGNPLDYYDFVEYIPELMFKSSKKYIGFEGHVQQSLLSSKHKDIKTTPLTKSHNTMLVTGGNTMIRGYEEKIYREFDKIGYNVDVKECYNKCYSAWLGGSIYSNLSSVQSLFISKNDYQEKGTNALFKKY